MFQPFGFGSPVLKCEFCMIILHFRNTEGTDAGTETDINLFNELYYHYLGTDQCEDILCWRDSEHAAWSASAKITDDGQV